MNYQSKLFALGMKPVYRTVGSMRSYKRIHGEVGFSNTAEGLTLTFSFTFNSGEPRGDATYFAFTYPFTYADIVAQCDELEARYSNHKDIYFHREVLVHSVEGRKMEMLTITSQDGGHSSPNNN